MPYCLKLENTIVIAKESFWGNPNQAPLALVGWTLGVSNSQDPQLFKLQTPVRNDVRDAPPVQLRLVSTSVSRAVVGAGEPLSAAQAGFYRNSQSCGWCGRNPFCSPGWFLLEFPELWLVWAKPLLQPRLGFTKIPGVCLAWAKPFLQPKLVFTRIPRGVLGVGETLSAAQTGFYKNSQRCAWHRRSLFCSPGCFTGISRPVNNVSGAFFAAQAAFDLN